MFGFYVSSHTDTYIKGIQVFWFNWSHTWVRVLKKVPSSQCFRLSRQDLKPGVQSHWQKSGLQMPAITLHYNNNSRRGKLSGCHWPSHLWQDLTGLGFFSDENYEVLYFHKIFMHSFHPRCRNPPSGKRPSSVHDVVWQCSRDVVILNGAAGVILIERQGQTKTKSGRSIVFFIVCMYLPKGFACSPTKKYLFPSQSWKH